jgi:hypothetical protein
VHSGLQRAKRKTFVHFYGSVTIEQILAGATVTMTDPATGYTATLVLHAR